MNAKEIRELRDPLLYPAALSFFPGSCDSLTDSVGGGEMSESKLKKTEGKSCLAYKSVPWVEVRVYMKLSQYLRSGF
jgi:hypothetical protein